MDKKTIDFFMNEAIKEAKKAYKKNEVPVGAVIVYKDKIIARAHNNREKKQLINGHAEFIAMLKASKRLKSWRLEDCDVYVTMEPCSMCAGAMIQARVRRCYFGTYDLKSGAIDSIINMFNLPFNHKVEAIKVDDFGKSELMLKTFFKEIRKK